MSYLSKATQQVGLTDNRSSYGKQYSNSDDSVEAFPKVSYTLTCQYSVLLEMFKNENITPFYFQHLFSSNSKNALAYTLGNRIDVTD